MAWFYFDRSSAARWFRHVLSCLLLWMTTFVRTLRGYIPLALRWSKDPSPRVGPERSETPCRVWWFWRVLSFSRFWMSKFVRVLRKHLPLAMAWRKDHGNNMAEAELVAERRNGENFPQGSPLYSDDETDQEDQYETQHEPVPVKTSAASARELAYAEPGWSEGEGSGSKRQVDRKVKTTDEFYCEYDSTWETEEDDTWQPKAKSYKFRRFENAAKDMQNYRHKYPNQNLSQSWNSPEMDTQPNLNFYLGKTPSVPDAVKIHEYHNEWFGSYDKLEYVHTFIQWLFPLPEPGMNYEATPLTRWEIEDFCRNSTARENLLKSYELMLDFYGICLCDQNTGEVERAPNWKDRFRNMNSHTHNSLRITRILKCLGILGFPHYQAPLVRFFLNETLIHGELQNVRESVLNYFLFAVLDREERRDLVKFAFKNYKDDEFVWCPKSIQEMWSCQSESEPQRGMNGDYQCEQ